MDDSPHEMGQKEPATDLAFARVACNRCRKGKLRCSRDRPSCTNCAKNDRECSYVTSRLKPGMKAGAIESIYKRLNALERAVFEKKSQSQPEDQEQSTIHQESSTRGGSNATERHRGSVSSGHGEPSRLINPASGSNTSSPAATSPQPLHGQGVGHDPASSALANDGNDDEDDNPPLPSIDSIQPLIAVYFSHIHPWIPMVNQDRFRQRLRNPRELQALNIVIQAIHISVSKYIPKEDSSWNWNSYWSVARIRRWIVATAMENMSLEGMQALIIIGNGNASRAWAIVASLTRTVEYCQLTRERDIGDRQPICRPYSFLSPAGDWTDEEERRRIFWNVFILDRFCSISTGWSISLTSTDVCRRLPSNGLLWRREEATLTPYLGVWDKSTGHMGMASSAGSPGNNIRQGPMDDSPQSLLSGVGLVTGASDIDMSAVGQFAYCVEAIESMSRVTNCFLQQTINPNDRKSVEWWLTRFKELDLRLAHWKMLLPHIWKPVTSSQGAKMDPNLTVAHLTHNASTILLHQPIAYPPTSWPLHSRMPSTWSAATCCHAGVEISTITQQYLRNTPSALPLSTQFAFCVYVAARMMLVHWRYDSKNKLLGDFWLLIESLDEMARRWTGACSAQGSRRQVAASQYATELRRLWQRSHQDENYELDVNGYTHEIEHRNTATADSHLHSETTLAREDIRNFASYYEGSLDLDQWAGSGSAEHQAEATSALHMATAANFFSTNEADTGGQQGLGDVDSTIPNVDDYLMDLDRVISYEDGSLFIANLDGGTW